MYSAMKNVDTNSLILKALLLLSLWHTVEGQIVSEDIRTFEGSFDGCYNSSYNYSLIRCGVMCVANRDCVGFYKSDNLSCSHCLISETNTTSLDTSNNGNKTFYVVSSASSRKQQLALPKGAKAGQVFLVHGLTGTV